MVSINFNNMHYKAYIRALYGVYTTSDTDKHIVSEIKFDVITHCFQHIYFLFYRPRRQPICRWCEFCPLPCHTHPPSKNQTEEHNPWASCQIRKIAGAHAPGMSGSFSPPPEANDPDMHHGTCVTHVPWCMPGSLTSGFLWNRRRGKTFPAFPAHAQPAMLRIC